LRLRKRLRELRTSHDVSDATIVHAVIAHHAIIMTRVPSRIDQSASTDHVVVARVDAAHAERSLIVDHATHALPKRASTRRRVLAPVTGARLRMNWPDRQKRLRMKIRRRPAARHPKKPKKSHHQSQRRSP